MTQRDCEALAEALRHARAAAIAQARSSTTSDPVDIAVMTAACFKEALERFVSHVRLPRSIEALPPSLREPVLHALEQAGEFELPQLIATDRE